MRRYFFITAVLLTSATAQAGPMRSLTLASSEQPAVTGTEAPKAVEAPAAATDAPKFQARPAVAATPAEPAKAEKTTPVVDKPIKTSTVDKPKRKRESTEARVIRELHRHGIYW